VPWPFRWPRRSDAATAALPGAPAAVSSGGLEAVDSSGGVEHAPGLGHMPAGDGGVRRLAEPTAAAVQLSPLPALVGPAPLTQRAGSFVASLAGARGLAPVLTPLGHARSADAPPGIVSNLAMPVAGTLRPSAPPSTGSEIGPDDSVSEGGEGPSPSDTMPRRRLASVTPELAEPARAMGTAAWPEGVAAIPRAMAAPLAGGPNAVGGVRPAEHGTVQRSSGDEGPPPTEGGSSPAPGPAATDDAGSSAPGPRLSVGQARRLGLGPPLAERPPTAQRLAGPPPPPLRPAGAPPGAPAVEPPTAARRAVTSETPAITGGVVQLAPRFRVLAESPALAGQHEAMVVQRQPVSGAAAAAPASGVASEAGPLERPRAGALTPASAPAKRSSILEQGAASGATVQRATDSWSDGPDRAEPEPQAPPEPVVTRSVERHPATGASAEGASASASPAIVGGGPFMAAPLALGRPPGLLEMPAAEPLSGPAGPSVPRPDGAFGGRADQQPGDRLGDHAKESPTALAPRPVGGAAEVPPPQATPARSPLLGARTPLGTSARRPSAAGAAGDLALQRSMAQATRPPATPGILSAVTGPGAVEGGAGRPETVSRLATPLASGGRWASAAARPAAAEPEPPVSGASDGAGDVIQRSLDGAVMAARASREAWSSDDGAGAPAIQRRAVTAAGGIGETPTPSGDSAGAAEMGPPGASAEMSDGQLDELAGRVYGRMRDRLAAELLRDRERAGLLPDL
jgi:hypothetical protein